MGYKRFYVLEDGDFIHESCYDKYCRSKWNVLPEEEKNKKVLAGEECQWCDKLFTEIDKIVRFDDKDYHYDCMKYIEWAWEQYHEASDYDSSFLESVWEESNVPIEEILEEYDEATEFIDDIARVRKGNKWGFLHRNGRPITPVQYDEVGLYAGEEFDLVARVKKNNKLGYVDVEGSEVIPPTYDKGSDFIDGYARVKKYGRWFYISSNGSVVDDEDIDTPIELDETEDESSGSLIPLKDEGRTIFIAITGSFSDTRSNIISKWKQYNVIVENGVSPKTDYLVTNENPCTGSKAVNAQVYGVAVVTEKEFEKLLLGE